MVDAHQVEDGGVEIVDVDRVLGDVVAVVVGRADAGAGVDAGAGQPHREGARVVVAAVIGLC